MSRNLLRLSLLVLSTVATMSHAGSLYVAEPGESSVGGTRSVSTGGSVVYAIAAVTGQSGGVGVNMSADYALRNGFLEASLSSDCDENGIPDSIDILNCPNGDVSCLDCDSDGILNRCELRDCPPATAACDDCNLNGVPDACDIVSGSSMDVIPSGGDGVPDECGSFDGGCIGNTIWSCPANWNLENQVTYPNDFNVPNAESGIYVSLAAGDEPLLDVDVQIPALTIQSGSTLNITQPPPSSGPGDLSFSLPGIFTIGGVINLGNGRTIGELPNGESVRPKVTITEGGVVQPSTTPNDGKIFAQTLTITDATPTTDLMHDGGRLDLHDAMSLAVFGDTIFDGRTAVSGCGGFAGRGGHTPPVLRAFNHALVQFLGDLTMFHSVEFNIQTDQPIELRGAFDNQLTDPVCFSCRDARFILAGNGPRVFEVAGVDAGPALAGFSNGGNQNYSLGQIEVVSGATVVFQDRFANTGAGPECEALYVERIILRPGSTITIDENFRCNVYYQALMDEGGTIIPNSSGNCGKFEPIVPAITLAPADDRCVGGANAGLPCSRSTDCEGGACHLKNRFLSVSLPAVDPNSAPLGIQVTLVNLDANSVATPASYNGTSRWAGAPTLGVVDGVSPSFNAAKLQCVFAPQDWGTIIGQIHLYGDVIVPQSSYDVSVCASIVGPCSTPLPVETAKFGDIIPPLNVTNFQDINSIVAKFQGKPNGPSKTRTKLREPLVLGNPVNFQDISADVDAFRGKPYKLSFPQSPVVCP